MSVSVTDFLKTYEKRFGGGARLASEVPDIAALPTGFPVLDDYVLGIGGFPRGRIVELFGAVSGGKSSLAQVLVGQTQKNGGLAVWFDAEGAFEKDWAKKMGVDVDKLVIPDFDFAEDMYEEMLYCIRAGVDLIVLDSLAAVEPKMFGGQKGKEGIWDKDPQPGVEARLIKRFCRDAINGSGERKSLRESSVCIVLINQVTSRFGVTFGNPETTPGGWAPKFFASVRLEVKRVGIEKKDDVIYRQKIRVVSKKSKVAPPFRTCDLYLFLDGKFEEDAQGLLLLAKEKKLVEISGSWVTWLPTGEKLQGTDTLGRYLRDSKEIEKLYIMKGDSDA